MIESDIRTDDCHTDGIRKQGILNLFNDCEIRVYPDEQIITYYNNNQWVGTYYLRTEKFYWSWYQISPFIDSEIKGNYQLIKELLRPIFEEIIKRKVFITSIF